MRSDAQRRADEIRDVNTRYHDVAAASYDSKWGIDFGEVGQGQVVGKLRKLLGSAALDRGFERSLEVGAGTGYFSLNLLRAGIVRDATCTDISPGMVRTLATNAERLGLTVKSLRADAESLPFAAESFDLVLGHAVLHHLPDLERAFSEFHRVLKPGGRIVFAGEPSRVGDRIAAIPKRGACAVAPAWRRALGAGPAAAAGPGIAQRAAITGSSRWSTSTRSPPTISCASPAPPGSTTSACAARSCSRTGSAGSTARSRRPPTRPTCRCCGASTRSAATCCSSASTSGCSSRCCRRRSSTTCCVTARRP